MNGTQYCVAGRRVGIVPGFARIQVVDDVVDDVLLDLVDVVQADLEVLEQLVIDPGDDLVVERGLDVLGDARKPVFPHHGNGIAPGPPQFVDIPVERRVGHAVSVVIPPVEIVGVPAERVDSLENRSPDIVAVHPVVKLDGGLAVAEEVVRQADSRREDAPIDDVVRAFHVELGVRVEADEGGDDGFAELIRPAAGLGMMHGGQPAVGVVIAETEVDGQAVLNGEGILQIEAELEEFRVGLISVLVGSEHFHADHPVPVPGPDIVAVHGRPIVGAAVPPIHVERVVFPDRPGIGAGLDLDARFQLMVAAEEVVLVAGQMSRHLRRRPSGPLVGPASAGSVIAAVVIIIIVGSRRSIPGRVSRMVASTSAYPARNSRNVFGSMTQFIAPVTA